MISLDSLVSALIYLVIWGVALYVMWWGLGKINPPEPFMKIGTVILVVITVVVLLNLLLDFAGHPIVSWRGTKLR